MDELTEFVAQRRDEIEAERLRLRDAISGSGGFTSPRAMEFMTAMQIRKIVLDEFERYSAFLRDRGLVAIETPETPARRPGRPRKETT